MFPPACVACGADEPTETLRYARRTQSWLNLLWFYFGARHRVDVPCCSPCRTRLKRQRFMRGLWFFVALLLAVSIVVPLYSDLPSGTRRLVGIATVIAVLSPIFVYEVVFPRPFDISVHRDSVNHEFADAEYAAWFLALNEEQGAEDV